MTTPIVPQPPRGDPSYDPPPASVPRTQPPSLQASGPDSRWHLPVEQPSYAPPPFAARPGKFAGLAWSSLILGIVGVVFSPMPIINNVSAMIAVVGMILAFIALFGSRKLLAGIGIGLCVLAIVFTIIKQNHDVAALGGQGGTISGQQAPSDTVQQLTFGQSFTYQDGTMITVAPPTLYQPSSTASTTAPRSVSMKITITNGTAKPMDLVLVSIQATAGEQAVEQVFDSAKGLDGTPSQTLPPRMSRIAWNFGGGPVMIRRR
jgi:hypothetical protein